MHQLARLAGGGDEVVPAARDVRFGVEAENVRGDGVAMMVIVKEPAVKGGVAESGLDRLKIHRGNDTRGRAAFEEICRPAPAVRPAFPQGLKPSRSC